MDAERLILGIETSCDETSAAVVRGRATLLSSVVASQIEIHRPYGGIVPEVASRQHLRAITPVVREAMEKAGAGWGDLCAVAVTHGPGLAGSLIVGVSYAKAAAWAAGLSLVGVNHIEAHLYAAWLQDGSTRLVAEPEFPLVCLVVSGGHTALVLMTDHGRYRVLGQTLDDAAGEAFDKVGRLFGLGYPGGPAIQRAAQGGDPRAHPLPRAWLEGTYDFSFSGLKTAALRLVRELTGVSTGIPSTEDLPPQVISDLAAGFQDAVVDVLVTKTARAAAEQGARQVVVAGGVAANRRLREEMVARSPVPVIVPQIEYCTDNAAMVAVCGGFHYRAGECARLDLDVLPSLRLPVVE